MLGPLEYSFGASFRLSICLAVVLGAAFAVLARRYHRSVAAIFSDWLLASSFAAVVAFTQYAPYDGRGRALDLRPFDTIWHALQGQGDTLILANLALFVPVGMAFATQGWRRGPTLAASAALSVAAEGMQYVTGNGRISQIDDVIVNTAGAFLGWLIIRSLRRVNPGAATSVQERSVRRPSGRTIQ